MKLFNILKRIIDLILSSILIVLLFPLLILTALLLLIFDGRPIFYLSKRVISRNREVTIFKFRSMVRDANAKKHNLEKLYMRDGFMDIPLNSPVYTPIGRILERLQIVELPQILNVLINKCSLVGNRPLPKKNVELLKDIDGWQERFDSPAGITGIAQIVGKYNLTTIQRIYLERMYSSVYKSQSGNILKCDFLILLYTLRLLITGKTLPFNDAVTMMLNCGASIPKQSIRNIQN